MYTKICKQCGKEGFLDLFQKDISKKDGVRPECKECTAINRKKRYSPSKNRVFNLQKKFGQGASDTYSQLFQEQQGLCAICGSPENGRYVHLSMDHCHDTGRIRGLLCNNCNRGIGLLKDNPELLRKAASYVEQHRE
jgi:hypothetical protein